jgi:hypothetical protein
MEQRLAVPFRRLLEPDGGVLADRLGVVGLGLLPAQHVQLKGGHLRGREAQAGAAARDGGGKVGAGPVDQRHEVVADRVDAIRRKVRHALPVVGE